MYKRQAEDRAVGRLWSLRPLKQDNPERVIALMGCMVGIKPNPALKARWYPNVDKARLTDGYIGEVSGQSRGDPTDLTLVRCDGGGCEPLDMGTPYDFFDPSAHTDAPGTTPVHLANRHRLRDARQLRGLLFGQRVQLAVAHHEHAVAACARSSRCASGMSA